MMASDHLMCHQIYHAIVSTFTESLSTKSYTTMVRFSICEFAFLEYSLLWNPKLAMAYSVWYLFLFQIRKFQMHTNSLYFL